MNERAEEPLSRQEVPGSAAATQITAIWKELRRAEGIKAVFCLERLRDELNQQQDRDDFAGVTISSSSGTLTSGYDYALLAWGWQRVPWSGAACWEFKAVGVMALPGREKVSVILTTGGLSLETLDRYASCCHLPLDDGRSLEERLRLAFEKTSYSLYGKFYSDFKSDSNVFEPLPKPEPDKVPYIRVRSDD